MNKNAGGSGGANAKRRSSGLPQIFRPIKEPNRKAEQSYVEDLVTQRGRKRCDKTGGRIFALAP